MPFAATTTDKVMGALALPLTRFYIEAVQDALDHAAVYGGETAIARIETYLTDYEAAQTALNTGATNAGLIKAGSLEWQLGARNSGFKSELNRLRSLVSASLNLDSLMPRSSGTVRMIR